MSMYFWSFIAGATTVLILQWLVSIPDMRTHRVVMALLERASMYQKRGKILAEEGRDEEAVAAFRECKTLLVQAEELHKRGRKTP
jgi:hypothetical protein